jgi:hypothetical protein
LNPWCIPVNKEDWEWQSWQTSGTIRHFLSYWTMQHYLTNLPQRFEICERLKWVEKDMNNFSEEQMKCEAAERKAEWNETEAVHKFWGDICELWK